MTSMMSDDKKSIEHIDQADFFTLAHESGPVFFEDIRMLLWNIKKRAQAPFAYAIDWERALYLR